MSRNSRSKMQDSDSDSTAPSGLHPYRFQEMALLLLFDLIYKITSPKKYSEKDYCIQIRSAMT